MNPKLLIFLAWIFYLLERHSADKLWLFCMVYCFVLAACTYFYRRETDKQKTSADSD